MIPGNENITVFLIEDNEIDIMGVKRAFMKSKLGNSIIVAADGIEALEKMRDGTSVQRPYLVLLDLNMPRMNGIEFLREVRSDEALKNSVIFVLTTSSAADDRLKAYNENIAGYIVKGKESGGFLNAAGLLDHYTSVCELP